MRLETFDNFKLCYNNYITSIRGLASSIKNMTHLRYLYLSNTDIESISESACNLKNLLTLRLRDCENLCYLPNGVRNMYNLKQTFTIHAYQVA